MWWAFLPSGRLLWTPVWVPGWWALIQPWARGGSGRLIGVYLSQGILILVELSGRYGRWEEVRCSQSRTNQRKRRCGRLQLPFATVFTIFFTFWSETRGIIKPMCWATIYKTKILLFTIQSSRRHISIPPVVSHNRNFFVHRCGYKIHKKKSTKQKIGIPAIQIPDHAAMAAAQPPLVHGTRSRQPGGPCASHRRGATHNGKSKLKVIYIL